MRVKVVYREYRPDHHLHVEFTIPPRILGIFRAEEWEGGWMWHAKAVLTLYTVPDTLHIHDRISFLKTIPRHGMTVTVRWDYWPSEEEWQAVARRLADAMKPTLNFVPA